VTWTAPTTDEYAISSYTVHMLDEEFPCNSSPCTIDTSALNVTDDTKVSAYVVVNYAEEFVKPFPVEASPELPALETIWMVFLSNLRSFLMQFNQKMKNWLWLL